MLDEIDKVFSYNENIMLMGDLKYDYKLDETVSYNPLHQIVIVNLLFIILLQAV